MASKSKSGPAIFVANEAFSLRGELVPAGATVAAGHALLKGRMHLFRPFQPTFGRLDYGEPEAPEIVAAEPASDPGPVAEDAEPSEAEDPADGGDA